MVTSSSRSFNPALFVVALHCRSSDVPSVDEYKFDLLIGGFVFYSESVSLPDGVSV